MEDYIIRRERPEERRAVGGALLLAFVVWTILIQTVDVQSVGAEGTDIGFAAVNTWFHALTGVHMGIYTVTDWLGLVPVAVCMGFSAFMVIGRLVAGVHWMTDIIGSLFLSGGLYLLCQGAVEGLDGKRTGEVPR